MSQVVNYIDESIGVETFRPQFIKVKEAIRRKKTKVKEGSISRKRFGLWQSRACRRWEKQPHFSNVA